MPRRAGSLAACALILLGASGCPVTDNYYIAPAASAAGSAGATSTAGGATGGGDVTSQSGSGASQAGSAVQAGGSAGDSFVATGGLPDIAAGAPNAGQAGDTTVPSCVPNPERCNGYDDDCNGKVDAAACATGCVGFTLMSQLSHGYMLCSGAQARKDWTHAKDNCAAEGMRLAWLESSQENAAVAATIKGLTNDTDVWLGSTDQGSEGNWRWDGTGGFQFWKSGQNGGSPVNGAFEAWPPGSPDNDNQQNCGVINPSNAAWRDRSCFAMFAYVCEEP